MARFDESIDVNASVSEVYNLFSQFERFPGFMEGVEEVRRTGDDKLYWKAEIGGREEEWEAKITKEQPDTAIAWQSVSGARNMGEVTFEKVDDDTTQINLHIEYEPEGFVENVGALLGVVNGRMRGDLQRFKELVESGGHTSGWHDPADRSGAAADRDRRVGEAQRSAHRDDVGYESREPGGMAREHDMNRELNSDMEMGRETNRDLSRDAGRDTNRGVNTGIDARGNAVDRGLDRAGTSMDRAGNAVERGVTETGDTVRDGLGRADDAFNRSADRVSDMANRGDPDLDVAYDADPLSRRDRRDG